MFVEGSTDSRTVRADSYRFTSQKSWALEAFYAALRVWPHPSAALRRRRQPPAPLAPFARRGCEGCEASAPAPRAALCRSRRSRRSRRRRAGCRRPGGRRSKLGKGQSGNRPGRLECAGIPKLFVCSFETLGKPTLSLVVQSLEGSNPAHCLESPAKGLPVGGGQDAV